MDPAVLEDCDIVVLAVPVIAMERILEDGFEARKLVTDVGSVKSGAVKAYRRSLAEGRLYHYVPGHPIAGDERSGPEAARKGLFEGARVILTPMGEPGPEEEAVRSMWESIGAKVQFMDPEEHDKVFAWVSHMPHIAAYAIIDSILQKDPRLMEMSGGGLRDYTRIAASSPRMWAEIAAANRKEILVATRGLRGSIDRIIAALERADREDLEKIFEVIATIRRNDI
jgi:prephenate dehydrogenase